MDMIAIPPIKEDDWVGLNRTIRKLANQLGVRGTPAYAQLTLTNLTASRIVASDANKKLVSADIAAWVLEGSSNQVVVTDEGDGTVTLSTPQNIHTGATPTFAGLTLSSIAAEGTDVDKFLVDSSGVIKYRTGAQVLSDIGGQASGNYITALTGEVTASGPGSVAATISNDAVTYAKMQNVSATDKILGRVTAGAGNVEEIACTAAGRAILDDADASAQRTTLGLAIGTNVQAWDDVLDDLAALSVVANNKFIVGTGAGVYAHESGATVRTSLGLGTGNNVTFNNITGNALWLAAGCGLSQNAGILYFNTATQIRGHISTTGTWTLGNFTATAAGVVNIVSSEKIPLTMTSTHGEGMATFEIIESGGGDWKIQAIAGATGFKIRDQGRTADRLKIGSDGGVFLYALKSGTTQGGAGAAADELWVDTDDGNTIKLGT